MSVISLAVVFIFGVSEMATQASGGNALAVARRVCRNPRADADATDEVFRRAEPGVARRRRRAPVRSRLHRRPRRAPSYGAGRGDRWR
jgi:hypothetical protein